MTLLPLRAIYKRALARPETGIAIDPTSDLQMPTVSGGRDRIASPDECGELLAALRPADRALWATAMYAGLRRGELMALLREGRGPCGRRNPRASRLGCGRGGR